MKFLFVALALVLAVTSQPPVERRCREAPSTFFGYFREVNYDARPEDVGFRFANISYSRTEMKVKVTEFERREGDRHFEIQTNLYDFNQKIHYQVTLGRCTKRPMEDDEKIPEFGIPTGATFFGADYIGAMTPGQGVLVEQFYHRDENGGDYHGSFAPVGGAGSTCWPLVENFVRRPSTHGPPTALVNVAITFMNLTTMLPLNAFKVPLQCSQQIRGRPLL